jgi:hypothetical protein
LSVTFIRRVTKVPTARQVIERGAWEQWAAESTLKELETVTCKTVPHGTLPNSLRERYGLPLIDEDKHFRDVNIQTWWGKQEAERVRAEREAKREAVREQAQSRVQRSAEDDAADEESPDH